MLVDEVDQDLEVLFELANAWQYTVEKLRERAVLMNRTDIDFDHLPPIFFATFRLGWRAAQERERVKL